MSFSDDFADTVIGTGQKCKCSMVITNEIRVAANNAADKPESQSVDDYLLTQADIGFGSACSCKGAPAKFVGNTIVAQCGQSPSDLGSRLPEGGNDR